MASSKSTATTKKFETFNDKTADQEDIGSVALLMHYVDILDQALLMAFERQEFELIITLSDKMQGASDRLMQYALRYGTETEEEIDNGKSLNRDFGFTHEFPIGPRQGDDSPDGEPWELREPDDGDNA